VSPIQPPQAGVDVDAVSYGSWSHAASLHLKSGKSQRLPMFNGAEVAFEQRLKRYLPAARFL
jgi:hypothetical protein